MTAITPGPWKLNKQSNFISAGERDHIRLADVGSRWITKEENEANARAIAQVPAMVELIQLAGGGFQPHVLQPRAKAILREIEG